MTRAGPTNCAFEEEFTARAREDEAARRLITIPGIGVMNATALIAAIGNGETFSRGRDFAASRRPPARPWSRCRARASRATSCGGHWGR